MGIDPGPSTGIALFNIESLESGWSVFQVDGGSAPWLIRSLIEDWAPVVVAIEEFEVRRGSAGTAGKDAELTRWLVHCTENLVAPRPNTLFRCRKPSLVKPWASDKRLAKTGFPWGAKFKDARDAGRHALYAAVRDGKERDPLV